MELTFNLDLYAKEAIMAVCYKYTDKFYIEQELENNFVLIRFKEKEHVTFPSNLKEQFCNDLIDQQIRYDINKQFGKIRDLIVEEAFKPVNNYGKI